LKKASLPTLVGEVGRNWSSEGQWRRWDKWEAVKGCEVDRLEIVELTISDYS
ncbi:98_t:CDS:2, partial [Funneliformis caledonium]